MNERVYVSKIELDASEFDDDDVLQPDDFFETLEDLKKTGLDRNIKLANTIVKIIGITVAKCQEFEEENIELKDHIRNNMGLSPAQFSALKKIFEETHPDLLQRVVDSVIKENKS